MPSYFDQTQPPDTEKAGLGAKRMRDDLKAAFNADFEGKLYELIDAAIECVKGWPRAYIAASGSPPSPPTNAKEGRLWFQTDTALLLVHDGTDWRQVRPACYAIPLATGPAKNEPSASWVDVAFLRYDGDAGVWAGMAWQAGHGVPFNLADVPDGAEVHLAVRGYSLAGTRHEVRLYDVGAAAAVTGSTLLITTALAVQDQESADLAGAMAAGDRLYRVQHQHVGSGSGGVVAAELRVYIA